MITWAFLPAPSRDDRRVSVTHSAGVSVLRVSNDINGAELRLESGPALDEADADDLRRDINDEDQKPWARAQWMSKEAA